MLDCFKGQDCPVGFFFFPFPLKATLLGFFAFAALILNQHSRNPLIPVYISIPGKQAGASFIQLMQFALSFRGTFMCNQLNQPCLWRTFISKVNTLNAMLFLWHLANVVPVWPRYLRFNLLAIIKVLHSNPCHSIHSIQSLRGWVDV